VRGRNGIIILRATPPPSSWILAPSSCFRKSSRQAAESLRGRQAGLSENNPGPPSRKVQNAWMRIFYQAVLGLLGQHARSLRKPPACPGAFRWPAPEPFGCSSVGTSSCSSEYCCGKTRCSKARLSGSSSLPDAAMKSIMSKTRLRQRWSFIQILHRYDCHPVRFIPGVTVERCLACEADGVWRGEAPEGLSS
jgi:hypothetical protein